MPFLTPLRPESCADQKASKWEDDDQESFNEAAYEDHMYDLMSDEE